MIRVTRNYPIGKTDAVAFPLKPVLKNGLDSHSAMVVWKESASGKRG